MLYGNKKYALFMSNIWPRWSYPTFPIILKVVTFWGTTIFIQSYGKINLFSAMTWKSLVSKIETPKIWQNKILVYNDINFCVFKNEAPQKIRQGICTYHVHFYMKNLKMCTKILCLNNKKDNHQILLKFENEWFPILYMEKAISHSWTLNIDRIY